MESAFSDSLMAYGGGSIPLTSQEIQTTKAMTRKFLQDVSIHKEGRNKKKLTYLAWFVNYRPKSRKSRCLKIGMLGMLT